MYTYLVTYYATVHGSAQKELCERKIQCNSKYEADIINALKTNLLTSGSDQTFCEMVTYVIIPAGYIPLAQIPDACVQCPCYQSYPKYSVCKALDKHITAPTWFNPFAERPDWCPIHLNKED